MTRRRRKRPEDHVNHERWLVSYADFITLLFAFFVVMFAVSQVDSKKVGRFTQSFKDALEWQVMQQPGSNAVQAGDSAFAVLPAQNAKASGKRGDTFDFEDEKASIRRGLMRRIGSTPMLSGLSMLEVRGELILRLPEKLMFDRGEALLRQEGGAALGAIADELQQRPVRIRVEGHTDSTPIRTSRFPSNWELSMARAMAVVAFFLENEKIAPPRLAAAGYGEHHPVAPNDSNDGRAQNRRVDLIVVADFGQAGEGAGHDGAATLGAAAGGAPNEPPDGELLATEPPEAPPAEAPPPATPPPDAGPPARRAPTRAVKGREGGPARPEETKP